MKEFTVGSVLSRSFSIWLKNLIPFTILTLLVYSPLVIYTLIVVSGDLTLDRIETWAYVTDGAGALMFLIASAAICYGTFEQLRGRHASIGQSIGVGLKRLLPVLGVGILAGVCVLGGFFLLIIPGVILFCMLWVAVPVAVVEKPGVLASLKRSAELTSGYKGQIFMLLFVLGIIDVGVGKILEKLFVNESMTLGELKAYMVVVLLAGIVIASLQAVAAALGYHDLREVKEGVDVEELVKVFE